MNALKTFLITVTLTSATVACDSGNGLPPPPPTPEGSFEGLGFAPESAWTEASDVSADGSVVLVVSFDAGEAASPYFWKDGELDALSGLSGSSFGPAGLSDDGSVIALTRCCDSAENPEAARWVDGTATGLGSLESDGWSSASAISADGAVVVGISASPGTGGMAFRWENGEMVSMSDLTSGEIDCCPSATSHNGAVIVGDDYRPSLDRREAYRWTGVGPDPWLGILPGAESSSATDVSANGNVVVGLSGDEAFRWENGEMEALGVLPGENSESHANAVSADGSVVVGANFFTEGRAAWIWMRNEGMRALQQILEDDYDLDLSGWALQSATAVTITDDALVIVGYGNNPDDRREAWRAVLE